VTAIVEDEPLAARVELTTRELQVIDLYGDGLGVEEISARLCIAVRTVKAHGENARRKLKVRSTAAAVAVAIRDGHLPVERDPGAPAIVPAERLVIELLAAGWQEAMIARLIGKSAGQVHRILKKLRAELGARNRAQLVKRAAQAGAYPRTEAGALVPEGPV
jgi:DNA-binding NarL/FixJ family response regulator